MAKGQSNLTTINPAGCPKVRPNHGGSTGGISITTVYFLATEWPHERG